MYGLPFHSSWFRHTIILRDGKVYPMRYKKMNWILKVLVHVLALYCWVSLSMAEENTPSMATEASLGPEEEESAISFETEGDFSLGYRWVSTEDSLKAAEYIYPHSSATFGLNLLSCPLPYRFHINGEFASKYDFYSDAGFAYKDLVLFRDILVGVHHNLNHYIYPSPPIRYHDERTDDTYYVDFARNLVSLRLKAPEFPLHGFVNHRHVERHGTIQQRFLLGYFEDLNMVSESRNIDWTSNGITLGTNSHLGPIEVEYAYDQSKFDPNGNNILYDNYPEFVGPPSRPADSYPHNVVPESESWGHSFKLHSSYTGGIVTAASVSNLSQENNYSGTESKTWKGAFDFSWIPAPVVGFFFKYRHKDVELDNPGEVALSGYPDIIYSVRPGISYDKDVFSLSSRYKALSSLTLYAAYEFSHLERKELSEWEILPERSNIHAIDLTAQAKPLDRVKVTAKYEYKNYDQPSYNSTPDYSNKLKLTTNYTPIPTLNLYLEYLLSASNRDSLSYLTGDPADPLNVGERDGRFDQFLASLTTALTPKVSLTASWFYLRWKVEQDLIYGKWPVNSGYYLDNSVPYTDESNTFSLSLHFTPWEDITATADISHSISKGTTGYRDVVGNADFSLSEFSNLEAAETSFSIALAKRFSTDWEIGLRSYMDIYNDKETDLLDGKVLINTITLKRYF
jgi:hypothetical protein